MTPSRGGAFLALLCAVMVAVQYAFILQAAARRLPMGFRRQDCIASAKGGKPVGSLRDCLEGQGYECTLAEPCTPCSEGGCQRCSASVVGYCGFMEGYAPYCSYPGVEGGRAYVAPCTRCCS